MLISQHTSFLWSIHTPMHLCCKELQRLNCCLYTNYCIIVLQQRSITFNLSSAVCCARLVAMKYEQTFICYNVHKNKRMVKTGDRHDIDKLTHPYQMTQVHPLYCRHFFIKIKITWCKHACI